MSEEIITSIGTLEWIIDERFFEELDFKNIRPTVEEDKKYGTRYAAQCEIPMLKVGSTPDEAKKRALETITYVAIHVLTEMRKDRCGLVFLCFATHQLYMDIKIVCHAYLPELK